MVVARHLLLFLPRYIFFLPLRLLPLHRYHSSFIPIKGWARLFAVSDANNSDGCPLLFRTVIARVSREFCNG